MKFKLSRRNLLHGITSSAASIHAQSYANVASASTSGMFVDIRDFSPKMDGSDDSKAVQAAIDYLTGSTTSSIDTDVDRIGIPGGTILVPGYLSLSKTIIVNKASIRFIGTNGYGMRSGQYAPAHNNGHWLPSVFRWIGDAGKDMFLYTDTREIYWEGVRFEGNDVRQPLSFHHFENTPNVLQTIGANIGKTFVDCHFGIYPWTDTGLHKGKMKTAILVDGDNANNDRLRTERCTIRGATVAAIDVQNSQSVWGIYEDLYLEKCNIGIRSSSHIQARNICFQQCDVGIEANDAVKVWCFHLNSENTQTVAKIKGSSSLFIWGGYSQTQEHGDGPFIAASEANSGTTIYLEGHRINKEANVKIPNKIEISSKIKTAKVVLNHVSFYGLKEEDFLQNTEDQKENNFLLESSNKNLILADSETGENYSLTIKAGKLDITKT